jgi:DNA-binding response OmpR family regulator
VRSLTQRKVAAVLLDSSVPDETGRTLLSILRSREDSRTLPVIVVTDERDIDHRGPRWRPAPTTT